MRISDWSSDVCSSDLPGQRVLERLLEREEFEHAFGDARVKADSALVRPDGIVVLDPPAALDADIALVILPTDAKGHDPVGLGDEIGRASCRESVCQYV